MEENKNQDKSTPPPPPPPRDVRTEDMPLPPQPTLPPIRKIEE